VQVHHDEGAANRIAPESCADTREGASPGIVRRWLASFRDGSSATTAKPHAIRSSALRQS
jgi:hypothetical protein